MSKKKITTTYIHKNLLKVKHKESFGVKHYDTYKTAYKIGKQLQYSDASPTSEKCINSMYQGDRETERVGSDILITSINVRGRIKLNAFSSLIQNKQDAHNIRVSLVLDRFPEGLVLDPTKVWSSVVAYPHTLAFRTTANITRYVVIRSEMFHLQSPSFLFSGDYSYFLGDSKYFEWFINCKIPVKFKYGYAGILALLNNALHITAVADYDAYCELDYKTRIRFKDN